MKEKVIGVILILSLIFITNNFSFAGIEDILMPEATILVKGRFFDKNMMIDTEKIINDPTLNASLIADYAVWKKSADTFLESLSHSNSGSLEIMFAVKKDGKFFFGCSGPMQDVLLVIGQIIGWSDTPNGWDMDDARFEPKDIALINMGWSELSNLKNKGYIAGLPNNIKIFRDSCSIEVQHKFEKRVTVIYYPIFIVRGNERVEHPELGTTDWGVGFQVNARWCPFASVFNNGTAKRSCQINYNGEIASFVYCGVCNNNGEESWVSLEDIEIVRQTNWGRKFKGIYGIYPQKVELGVQKTWSHVSSTFTITVVGDSVSVTDWNEVPNLGRRNNPPPDVLILEPDTWYGDFLYSPENPKTDEVVTFDSYTNVLDPNNEVLRYIWHFGDGNSAEGINVTYSYQCPGNYNVILERIDTNEKVTTYQDLISIYKENCSIIEQIMKNAKLIEAVKTYSKVDLSAILKDPEYYAIQEKDFIVWEKNLNKINATFPDVSLLFAINQSGDFYIGAMGNDADVLSVLTTGGITTPSTWGYPIPEGRELTDPWIKLNDKANMLASLLGNYILEFKEKGYMDGGPELVNSIYGPDRFWEGTGKILLDLDRLDFTLINRFGKPITILFTGIYMLHSDYEFCCGGPFDTPFSSEVHNWPLYDARHHHWNPRPTDTSDARSYRRLTLNYEGNEDASFVTANVNVDNGNEGYVEFDKEVFVQFKDCCGKTERMANIYPKDIELYLKSHWSGHYVSFKIAVLGGGIRYSDPVEITYDYSGNEIEEPGMDGNPPPFIWEIPPTEEPCLIIDDISPYKFTETDEYIYLYGTASINNEPVEAGDVIYVFSQGVMVNNECIGFAHINEEGEYFVRIFADDPDTEEKEGAQPGNALYFKVFDKSKDEIIDLYPPNWNVVKWPDSEESSLNVTLSHEFEIQPQQSINLGTIERWNYGPINSVENTKNRFSYCGTELGLLIIDVNDPQVPKDIAFLDIGGVYDIALTESGEYLLLAMGESGILIFKIDPLTHEKLSYIGALDVFEDARKITLSGNYGYIADPYKGMVVIDISDTKRPKYIGLYSNSDIFENNEIKDICISGKYAYIANGAKGLVIVDISNPAIPEYVSSFNTLGGIYALKKEGNYVYIAYGEDGGKGGLAILDISEPNSPRKAGGVDFVWRTASDVEIINNCALVACATEGLVVIDVSDPNRPVYGGKFYTTGSSKDISIVGDYAYIADGIGGLVIFDITDPVGSLFEGKFADSNIYTYTYDVTVDAHYAYVVDEYKGLMILDIADPNDPLYTSYSFLDDLSKFLQDLVGDHSYFTNYYIKKVTYHDVKISGNHAYVTYDNIILFNYYDMLFNNLYDYSGILVVDISDKSMPHITGIGTSYPSGMPNGLDIKGNYAYVGEYYYGLVIYDITDPNEPDMIDNYYHSPGVQNLFIDSDYAYMACGKKGLEIIDISDPMNPKIKGSFDTLDSAMNLYVSGEIAYIADGDDGLVILDVSDPTAPVYLGGYDTPHYCDDVVVDGNFAFIADHFYGLTVVDVSNPSKPMYAGGYDRLNVDPLGFIRNKARGIEVDNNYAYIANSEHGLVIVNVEDPTGLRYLGRFDTSGYNKNIMIIDDYAYMANGYKGLSILHISDPTGPKYIGGFDTYGFVLDLDIKGNYAYLANDNSGLVAIDITNRNTPNLAGNLDTEGPALSIAVKDNYAYVATGEYGLTIADISNPNQLKYVSSFDTEGFSLDVEVDGKNHAYIADYQNGLVVINISDPNIPEFCSKVYIPGGTRDIYLSGNYAFVIDGDNGLGILDISDPQSPGYISRYQLSEYPISVGVSKDYAYVATNNGSLTVINITDPENPTLAVRYDTAEYVEGIIVSGDYLYVADGMNGLLEFKIDFNPSLKGNLLLVAGGGADSENSLWPVTQELANNIFRLFRENGYEVFDIWYQNPVYSQDINGDLFYDKYTVDDSTPTKAEFKEDIRYRPINYPNTGPLYICLIGHGAEDRFQIMPNEVITAKELKESIDKFQNGFTDESGDFHSGTDRQVVIIIESAASGSFLDDLNGDNISVITSTGEDASYIKPDYDPNASIPYKSFIRAFFFDPNINPFIHVNPLSNDPTVINDYLKNAFLHARNTFLGWVKEGLPFCQQAPQMISPSSRFTSLSFSDDARTPLDEDSVFLDQNKVTLTLIGKDPNGVYNPKLLPTFTFFSSDPNILDPSQSDDIKSFTDTNNVPWYTLYPKKNGPVFLIAYTDSDPNFLLSATLSLEVAHPDLPSVKGKMAIIMAGYKESGDYLWDSTNTIANHAYQTLRAVGYTKDEIYYYSPYLLQDLDNREGFEVRGYPHTNTIFNSTSSDCPFGKLQTAGATDLFLFMVDHGNKGSFYLNPKEDPLEADFLMEQLLEVSDKVDNKITLLYDACYSGSFLNEIDETFSDKFIAITSTDPNQTAYYLAQGLVSFSYPFFDEWYLTHSLESAFDYAQRQLPLKGQTPCISDPNKIKLYDRENIYFVDESRPSIDEVTGYRAEEGNLHLSARIYSLTGIKEVFAIVENVKNPVHSSTGSAITEAPRLSLVPSDPNNPYGGEYRLENTKDPCPHEANYILALYAVDKSQRPKTASYKQPIGSPSENKTVAFIFESGTDQFPQEDTTTWTQRRNQADRAEAVLRKRGVEECNIHKVSSPDAFNSLPIPDKDQILFLYLIGQVDRIEINGELTPCFFFDKDSYLTSGALQSQSWFPKDPNQRALVLADTPYAEQFLSSLIDPNSWPKNWAGISGTNQGNLLFEIGEGEKIFPCFSNFFFSNVLAGATVSQAFRLAQNAVSLTRQRPRLFLPERELSYRTINQRLGYYLGVSAIAGDDKSLIIDCKAREETVGGKSYYKLTLTPHPEAHHPMDAWVVLTSSPSSMFEKSTVIDLDRWQDSEGKVIYYIQEEGDPDFYQAYFMVEGKIEDASDPDCPTWTDWKKVDIVKISPHEIGRDIFEPDDDPDDLLQYVNRKIKVNEMPIIRTFYQQNNNIVCTDFDWMYFEATDENIYEIYAQDLSEYGYFIQLSLFDPNLNLLCDPNTHQYLSDNNFLSFFCKRTGTYLIRTQLASSYPQGGVEYILSVTNPQAQDSATLRGQVRSFDGKGINNLDIHLVDSGGVEYATKTVSWLGTDEKGFYFIPPFTGYDDVTVSVRDAGEPLSLYYDHNIVEAIHLYQDYNQLTPSTDNKLNIILSRDSGSIYNMRKGEIILPPVPPPGDIDPGFPPLGDYDGDTICNQDEILSFATSPTSPTIGIPYSEGINIFYFPSIGSTFNVINPEPETSATSEPEQLLYEYKHEGKYWSLLSNDGQFNAGNYTLDPDRFYALKSEKSGILFLEIQPDCTKPVLILKGFHDPNHPNTTPVDYLDNNLFDINYFDQGSTTFEVLNTSDQDIVMGAIHLIRSQNDYRGSWETSYRFFGKTAGKEIPIIPAIVYIVTKKRERWP